MPAVEIKTAILGYTALSLCSHQPAAIGVEFACGQHCSPESGITGSASSVQGVVLLRDLKLRFWELMLHGGMSQMSLVFNLQSEWVLWSSGLS